jgi:protein gp37
VSGKTKIEWTDATWGPILGCDKISPGCASCYAVLTCWRLQHNPNPKIAAQYAGLVEKLPNGKLNWTGRINLIEERLTQPLHWREPRRVFVNSQSDLFHDKVPDEFIDRIFAVMALCPQHTFQILTKRPERMREYLARDEESRKDAIGQAAYDDHGEMFSGAPDCGEGFHYLEWPLPNCWLGVSVENQQTADSRVPLLLQTPAAVRWVSAEPLLGPIDLTRVDGGAIDRDAAGITLDALTGGRASSTPWHLNWVVVGGESGPGARRFKVGWARSIVAQCEAAGVPCFVKQIGANAWDGARGLSHKLRDRKGGDPVEWPEDLRVREFPSPPAL